MPTIAIFGATGTQGSSVLEAVLADGKYTPRAVTRSLDTDASKALIARGVEVVVGDLWDKDEVVFGVRKGEITQGKNLVDAAKQVGVKFFIWSSLPNVTKESNGLYKNNYLKASGVPYAVLLTGWFLENLWKFGFLKKTATEYTIPISKYGPEDTQAATWVAHDLGAAAVALLTHYPDASKGVLRKSYPVISARFTYPELAAAIAAAKIGMYTSTPTPNPDLVTLGVKFSTLEECIQKDLVPRIA
ncbi:hypothetical protein DFH06DRAFT_1266236 [Mycena polygramma]|nr:hypothetical protein DFH06DRAFT_1266236 [Mycena polygramma]